MKLETRFLQIQKLLQKVLPLISQWDLNVIKGEGLTHPWLEEILSFSTEQFEQFDAKRDPYVLTNKSWLTFIQELEVLKDFPKIPIEKIDLLTIGKKKKQHEYQQLYHFLKMDSHKSVYDYGGGVGNLAYFLEKNLEMKVTVLERDGNLIKKGKERAQRLNSKIKFELAEISQTPFEFTQKKELSVGLHTCGNFATNMFKDCIKNETSKIINFGCCYSKIKNNDYSLNKLSDSEIRLNQRALCAATLGTSKVPLEIYNYRLRIMEYKYSFYHWLYKSEKILKFCAMSNARRTLYNKSFVEFTHINIQKFFPKLDMPKEDELTTFYESPENKNLNLYFKAYYALYRYLGQLAELYILCDRALFLQENHYESSIYEVFNPIISPRNKAILAERINNN